MSKPERILVFRIGQLGDVLASVPALVATRRYFAQAHIGLLCDFHPGTGYVSAREVLHGSGLVDSFLCYPVLIRRGTRRVAEAAALLWRIWRGRYQAIVYLAPSRRSAAQVERDRRVFRLAGIQRQIGLDTFHPLPLRAEGGVLPAVPRESDLLLERLAQAGIPTTNLPKDGLRLNVGRNEEEGVLRWLRSLPSDGGRRWIAVSPGSKMPIKRWPPERYEQVVAELIASHGVWPVIFGGREDCDLGESLLRRWGKGYLAAGRLSIRESLAAISRCGLYVGNDTGVMHMAGAMGVRCVAVFTARDYPGNWYPWGEGHVILRNRAPCEGCMETVRCVHGRTCVLSIGVEDVLRACKEVLDKSTDGCGTGVISCTG
jgi:ADP-heptose:LPS heptosyltransferase